MASFEENANTIGDVLFALPRVLGDSSSGTVAGPFADSRGIIDPRIHLNPGILNDANGASGLTAVLYIRPDNVTDSGNSIVRGQHTSSITNLYIRQQSDDLRIGGRSESTELFENTTVTTVLTANTWIFVGLSLDFANDDLIYRIGTTTGTNSVTFTSSTAVYSSMFALNLGFLDDADEEFNGAVAHFYLFDKALTAANLTTLFNSTSGYPATTSPATTPDTKTHTFNPDNKHADIDLSNGNKTATYGAASGTVSGFVPFTAGFQQSKIYYEATLDDIDTGSIRNFVGFIGQSSTQNWIGFASDTIGIREDGDVSTGGSKLGVDSNLPTFTAGMRVCAACDCDTGKVWLGYINGSNQQVWHGGGNPATDTTPTDTIGDWSGELVIPAVTTYRATAAIDLHTDPSDFLADVPSGFTAIQYAASAEAGANLLISTPRMISA